MSDNNTSTEPLVIRPSVVGMAAAMERKLRKHDATRGITGWRGFDREQLLEQLRTEVDELDAVVTNAAPKPQTGETTPFRNQLLQDRITDEAADVANMAMMVADVDGDLERDGALWALVRVDTPEDTGKEDIAPAKAPVEDRTGTAAKAADEGIARQDRIDRFQRLRDDALASIGAHPEQGEIAEMALLAMEHLDWLGKAPTGDAALLEFGRAYVEARPLGERILATGHDLVLAARIAIDSMRSDDQDEDTECDWDVERSLLHHHAALFLQLTETRHCRICLCTDEHGCRPDAGQPEHEDSCGWTEEDLCCRCAHCIDDGQRTPTPETPAPEPVTTCMPGETVTFREGDPLVTIAGNLPIQVGTAPGHITVRAVDLAPETRTIAESRQEATGKILATTIEALIDIWTDEQGN